jgi:hypothetical protein
MEADLNIQEMVISQDGTVKLSYVFSIKTSEFSGPVAGGASTVSDPEVLSQAQQLVEAAKGAAMRELGLEKKREEEPLGLPLDEDSL